MLAAEREREPPPFGGWGGEMATPVPEPSPSPPLAPLVIEPPPPWAGDKPTCPSDEESAS